MIAADDLEYHTPPDAGHTWAETYFFPIAIPDERLMMTVYVVIRPGLRVMVNDVAVYGSLSDTRSDLVYFHVEPHLPAPERFSDIRSPMGLSIKALNSPRDYRIDYVGYDDTELHVDWIGLMDPWDIHDPAHSPRAGKTKAQQHSGSGLGAAWGGHFGQSGRVCGTMKVRGREYQVDCVERMDHAGRARGALGRAASARPELLGPSRAREPRGLRGRGGRRRDTEPGREPRRRALRRPARPEASLVRAARIRGGTGPASEPRRPSGIELQRTDRRSEPPGGSHQRATQDRR